MTSVTAGSSVVLQGTVIDTSPGASQNGVKAKFPNGLPAVSDADQQKWMEYVYEQQAKPTDAKGVDVSIDATDPNNNLIHIGTTTSDTSGTFGYAWTPPDVPGTYKITATFAGSKSYGSSYAETYAVVTSAPATPTPQPKIEVPDNTSTIIGMGIAIIIAIALVGVLVLRKRP